MYFSDDEIQCLTYQYHKIHKEHNELLLKCQRLKLSLKNDDTHELLFQGFMRRIKTLKRCINNIWNIYPPNESKKPTQDELDDLSINLQSFIWNIFGSIDNLAWIWVKEKDFSYKRNTDVKFSNSKIKQLLSLDFQKCLEKFKDWFNYLENYRHALAHRIPLYVPPCQFNKEEGEEYQKLEKEKYEALGQRDLKKYGELKLKQDNLGRFIPYIMHSYKENACPIVFHPKIFADWNIIIEISNEFFKELCPV